MSELLDFSIFKFAYVLCICVLMYSLGEDGTRGNLTIDVVMDNKVYELTHKGM